MIVRQIAPAGDCTQTKMGRQLTQSRREFLGKAGLSLVGSVCSRSAAATKAFSSAPNFASEILKPSQFGAVGNGVVDDTAALQRAVSAAIAQGRILDLDRGTYLVTGSVVGSGDIRIINTGEAVIDATNGKYDHFGVLVLAGGAERAGRLAASAVRGDTKLVMSAAANFNVGEVGVIYNSSDFSFSGFRRYYRAGEFVEVVDVAGVTASLRNPLFADYDPDAVELYKVEPIKGFVRDLIIRSRGSPESLLVIDYANGFEVSNAKLRHANNACIVISRSIHCTINDPKIENAGDGGDDYGVVWSNSQHCRLHGGEIFARRHAVAVGGANVVNSVPCRDIVIKNAVLRNDRSTSVHCADIHGNSEQCGYDACTIFGGFSPQGRSSFLRNSTVYAMGIGTAVYAAELIGGAHVIDGNTFIFDSDPSLVSRGALDFGGNSDAITQNTVETLTITAQNNVFISTAFSENTMLLYARNAGSLSKINVRFANNELRVNDFSAAVRLRRGKGSVGSDFLSVEGNLTSLRDRKAVYPDGEYSALFGGRATVGNE